MPMRPRIRLASSIDLRLLGLQLRQPERGGDDADALMAVQRDAEVVEHGEVREQADVLQRAADAALGPRARRQAQAGRRRGADGARGHAPEAGDALHERRLAGAVRADEPDDLAFPYRQVDAVERGETAEADRRRLGTR